jgi:epoxyqueuosine reductase
MSLLAEFVKQAALDEGFALAGIAPVAPLGELDYFPAWIAGGFHGEMEYLAKRNDAGELRRAAISNVAPWARSVVVCAANYNSDAPYSTACDDPKRGWISRYAFVHSDYHEVLLARLRRIERRMVDRIVEHNIESNIDRNPAGGNATPRTWCYVDTGPVVERVLASAAWLLAVSRRDSLLASSATRFACPRPLRLLHALYRCLPHRGIPCAATTRSPPLHLLPHD